MDANQSDPIADKLQTVYEAIKRERPWDIRPVKNIYTTAKEKYMIELIKEGHDISDDTIAHVVGRCCKLHHFDDGRYVCWFGFILTREEYPDEHFKCESFHTLNRHLKCSNGAIYYSVDSLSNPFGDWHPTKLILNSEIQEVSGMIEEEWPNDWYEIEMHKYTLKHSIKFCRSRFFAAELWLRRYQTSQQITDQRIISSTKDAMKLFYRICHRNFFNPQVVPTFRLTWPETFLMNKIMSGEDISNEVISHVLDGCYTFGHLLTEEYACCRGYILTRDLFLNHDVRNCTSHHTINEDLKCYKGRVYHKNAEMPYSRIANMADRHSMHFRDNIGYGSIPLLMDQDYLQRQIQDIPRLPYRRAPPPPDHLDQQPLQQPARIDIQENRGVHVEQNDGEQGAVGNEQEDRLARPHLRHNRASPPPEIEI